MASRPAGSTIVISESASVSRLRPVTGGPGGELRIAGKAVIGGAMTGITGPDEIGKTETGGPVTGPAGTDDSGDPPAAGLVLQAARPTVARLAVISAVQTCARVARRMLVRRPAATRGSVPGPQDRAGSLARGSGRASNASAARAEPITRR